MGENIFVSILLLLAFVISVDVSTAQEWEHYDVANGLVGKSIWFIREDSRGYLWFITDFSGASRYDGVRFENFTEVNGLVSTNIYFILPDSESGYIWFATDCGASRYDGRTFENFDDRNGLADRNVNSILKDRHGNFWFATGKGVSRYDGIGFQNFSDADGLIDNNVRTILEDKEGNLWFGTQRGASKYDGDKFLVSNLHEQIQKIFEDKDGNLWFGTRQGVYRRLYGGSKIEGPWLREASISLIMQDRNGNLWFGGDLGAVGYKKDESFIRQDELLGNPVHSMLEDDRGDLWFGTDKDIRRYDGNRVDYFTEILDTTITAVSDILRDSDENLWFGTGNGVYKYTMQNMQTFSKESGLVNDSAKDMLEDREGNLWFGTKEGISIYDGKEFTSFGVRDNLIGNWILSILQDSNGNLWFGTQDGVSRYDWIDFAAILDSQTFSDPTTRKILENKVTKELWFAIVDGVVKYDKGSLEFWPIEGGLEMFIDSSRNLWVGSRDGGIHKYDGRNWKQYTTEDGLGTNHVTWILETHDGNIWFGFEGGGICRHNGVDFRNFTVNDGLASNWIRNACEDSKGRLWLATDKGVSRCDDHTAQGSLSFQTTTKTNGLVSNDVRSILPAKEGSLWFGTDKGASKYDGESFQNISLNLTRGCIHLIFEDSLGSIYFVTTRDGVVKYIPASKQIRPRIHITQIEADRIYNSFGNIRIPSATKRITFEYKGISFRTRADEMRYTYQLEGYDKSWCLPANDTRIHYENLKPGHYQFRVYAIDKDLHRSEPHATADIDIFRPFYLTPQFIVLVVLGGICSLGGGGYLIIQLKEQRRTASQLRDKLRKQEETERIQTARMRSLRQLTAGLAHQMKNPVSTILSNSDIVYRSSRKISSILVQGSAEQDLQGNKQLVTTLNALEGRSRDIKNESKRAADIVDKMESFVGLDEAEWQIADIHAGMNIAITLIEALMEDEEYSDRPSITKNYSDLPRINCSPSSINQVFISMLRNACEAIEDGGSITVSTSAQEGFVKIEISDTGRGISPENLDRIFDPGFTTKSEGIGMGLGLSICHKIIVDEHKGHIDVSSELGKGTKFTITLPLS